MDYKPNEYGDGFDTVDDEVYKNNRRMLRYKRRQRIAKIKEAVISGSCGILIFIIFYLLFLK